MANPQLEDGHLCLANEIAEAFARVNLTAYEWRVLWVILRKTYGWRKKEDRIAQSQIAQMTGIAKSHVSRTLKLLAQRQIVTPLGNKHIGLNKDYDQWQIEKLPNQVTHEKLPRGVTKVTPLGNKKLPREAPQKTIKKEEEKRICSTWAVLLEDVEWLTLQRQRFPTVNQNFELEKMRLWLDGNPKKQFKNLRLFALNWFERAARDKHQQNDSPPPQQSDVDRQFELARQNTIRLKAQTHP